jgi:hypothetical protein
MQASAGGRAGCSVFRQKKSQNLPGGPATGLLMLEHHTENTACINKDTEVEEGGTMKKNRSGGELEEWGEMWTKPCNIQVVRQLAK